MVLFLVQTWIQLLTSLLTWIQIRNTACTKFRGSGSGFYTCNLCWESGSTLSLLSWMRILLWMRIRIQEQGNWSRLPAIVLLIFSCYVQIQLFVAVKSDQDPDPHWGKKLDPDPHWNQCGSGTLSQLILKFTIFIGSGTVGHQEWQREGRCKKELFHLINRNVLFVQLFFELNFLLKLKFLMYMYIVTVAL